MKRLLTTLVFLVMAFPMLAQVPAKSALKLATLCYEKELSNRPQSLVQSNPTNSDSAEKKETQNTDEVYAKIAAAYQEQFTLQEIDALLAFYNSPLGTKVIAKQTELQHKAMTIIRHWEMKKLGLDITAPRTPLIPDEAQLLARQQKKVAPRAETPFPKIETLEDLKKALLKDPRLIYNPRLLEQIVGKEEFEKLSVLPIKLPQDSNDPSKKLNSTTVK